MKGFIKIGKGTLIKALGIQQNYKIIEEQKQVFSKECSKCYHYLLSETSSCSGCPYYRTCNKYSYVNEKNRYGYQERLSGNALKLFLYYHFIGPDATGIVKGISFKQAAEKIGCTVRTIKNNHETLIKYGYIMSCRDACSNVSSVMIYLPEYKKYFASGRNGGTGYLTIAEDLFDQLLLIHDVNELRLTLRTVLDYDNKQGKLALSKDYSELKRYLPRYFNRSLIQKTLSDSKVLSIEMNSNKVFFHLKDEYKGKETRNRILLQNKADIQKYIDTVNSYFANYNTNPALYSRLLMAESIDFDLEEVIVPVRLDYSEKDLDDLSLISLDSGLSNLIDIVTYIYQYYVIMGEKIKSIGALARSTLNDIKQMIS